MKALDLTGMRFGRLTALSPGKNPQNKYGWNCACICGKSAFVATHDLLSGHTQSCGCLQRERIIKASKTHGMRHTTIYHRWIDMTQRCTNQRNNRWKSYGGKGITVCPEWRDSFESFFEWAMANGYADYLTIDRIDVNGNYCPENCRWIPMREQARNKSSNVIIEHNGEKKTVAEWSEITGIKYATLLYRAHSGMSNDKIFYKGSLNNATTN